MFDFDWFVYILGDFHYQNHKRNLYEKVNILSIPEGLFGDGIKPKSFYLSSSNHVIVDDGYETAGLTSAEGHMLIEICQRMPRNHSSAVNARYNLMKNCSSSDINKLSLMGIL